MLEQHKAVLKQVFGPLFNDNQLDLIPDLYTEDVRGFDAASQTELVGHGVIRDLVAGFRTAFPAHRYTLHDLVGEGDKVCARWSVTDPERFPGFEVAGLSLCQFRDGKVCQIWQQFDDLGLLQHLEAVDKDMNLATAVLGNA